MNLQSLTPVGEALMQGLWQGALVTIIVCLTLRWIQSARYRYIVLWTNLAVAMLLPLAYYLSAPGKLIAIPAISTAQPVEPDLPWVAILAALWIVGVAFAMVRLLVAFVQVRNFSRSCEPASSELRAIRDKVASRMGIKRYVRVRISSNVEAPATIGDARPIVVWPAFGCQPLNESESEALMAHELAHIKQHDYAMHLLQRACESILWFNPAAWWIGNRLRQEREKAADELAASVLQDGKGLAIALGRLALQRTPHAQLRLAAGDGDVRERMRTLKVWTPRRFTPRNAMGVLFALGLLGTTAVLSARSAAANKIQTVLVSPHAVAIKLLPGDATKDRLIVLESGDGQLRTARASVRTTSFSSEQMTSKNVIYIKVSSGGAFYGEKEVLVKGSPLKAEGGSYAAEQLMFHGVGVDQFNLPLNGLP